jgi:hypothetical protein
MNPGEQTDPLPYPLPLEGERGPLGGRVRERFMGGSCLAAGLRDFVPFRMVDEIDSRST